VIPTAWQIVSGLIEIAVALFGRRRPVLRDPPPSEVPPIVRGDDGPVALSPHRDDSTARAVERLLSL
jgi:hypothetical protein